MGDCDILQVLGPFAIDDEVGESPDRRSTGATPNTDAHRTLKAETARPPAATMEGQQKKFDLFREEFNHVRSHRGLNGQRPASLLRACRRSLPSRVPNPEYPAHYETRRVQQVGTIKFYGREIFLSECLSGERIGLEETDDGIWTIHFATVELGRYNERTKTIT